MPTAVKRETYCFISYLYHTIFNVVAKRRLANFQRNVVFKCFKVAQKKIEHLGHENYSKGTEIRRCYNIKCYKLPIIYQKKSSTIISHGYVVLDIDNTNFKNMLLNTDTYVKIRTIINIQAFVRHFAEYV